MAERTEVIVIGGGQAGLAAGYYLAQARIPFLILDAEVHFTSFEMIDSFILVAMSFGHRFELNLLGLSTLVLPARDAGAADLTPIAEIQLALRATLVPDDGVFSVSAQLTPNSYLLSRDCHLTGGFAFSSWFGGPTTAISC